MIKNRIAVSFGAEFTRLATSDALIFDDLTMICWNKKENSILFTGKDAKQMLDRVDKPLKVLNPLAENKCIDKDLFVLYTDFIFNKFKTILEDREIVISLINDDEEIKDMLIKVLWKYNVDNVVFVSDVYSSAIGTTANVFDTYGTIFLNLDYFVSKASIIANGKIIIEKEIAFGEKNIDEMLLSFIKENFKIVVEQNIIEQIKWSLGTLIKIKDNFELTLKGKDIFTNTNKEIVVTSDVFKKIFISCFGNFKNLINDLLKETPLTYRTGVMKNGINVCGELSSIIGVKDFFENHFDFPAKVAKNKGYTVIEGLMKYEK